MGIVIAGGQSRRMGAEKTLLQIGDQTILQRTLERLSAQVDQVALNANGNVDRLAAFGLPIIPDRRTDLGTPLAGLHAGLSWAVEHDFDHVVTVPSDCPFLPADLVGRFTRRPTRPTIAASLGQCHFLTGLWPTRCLDLLGEAIDQRHLRSMKSWASAAQVEIETWQAEKFDPFFNVNTPDDLAEAVQIAAEFSA
ncbi:MAG: molybdenum cofactor guanylyltransferase [Alphaproteobacteria bacterium]|nr:molybdenum cofactor guanylyltransferase [Alphaproteobacteria bacterium]